MSILVLSRRARDQKFKVGLALILLDPEFSRVVSSTFHIEVSLRDLFVRPFRGEINSSYKKHSGLALLRPICGFKWKAKPLISGNSFYHGTTVLLRVL